ncbi:MAG TPA: AI-2E family transporter [Terriglobales bacterium]|nr:AI-2E family transporter [Terriglobales bacterium]
MASEHRSTILFAVLVGISLYVAYLVRDVLLLVYVSALFAVVLSPVLQGIRKLHLGKWQPSTGFAIILLLLGGAGLLALFFSLAVPPIYRDARELAQDWPRQLGAVAERLRHLPFGLEFDPASLQQYADEAIGGAFGLFKRVAGGVFWLFSWLILTVYFILDGERTFHWAMSMVPHEHRSRLQATLLRARRRMSLWLIGQGMLMLSLGALSAIALGLLGVRYFYALAVLGGLANLVPIIGPVFTVLVAGVVALIDGWGKLLGVLAFYLAYQQLENAFLTPRIMRQTVNLPPLAVITALTVGGALAGVLGALVAVPSAALAAVLIDEYLVKKDSILVATGSAATEPQPALAGTSPSKDS